MSVVKILVVNNGFYLINSAGDLMNNDSLMPFIASFHNNLESFIPLANICNVNMFIAGEEIDNK